MIPHNVRNSSLDIARGVAVMGILLMNIVAFAWPEAAYINPRAGGGTGFADIATWFTTFVLIDGKMRGLFSLLFGASILIVMDRAEMAGGDGRRAQLARAAVLLGIGLAHYLLLWWGDILALYAGAGLIAMLCAGKQPLALVKFAFLAFGAHCIMLIALMVTIWHSQSVAMAPGASATSLIQYASALEGISDPSSGAIGAEMARMRGSYSGIFAYKLAHIGQWAAGGVQYMLLDTLGFMLLGMAMLKGGFLSGEWRDEPYWQTARHCFLIAVPPMIALAVWVVTSGFDTVTTFGVVFAWSFPMRIPLTVGWAALIFWSAARYHKTRLARRIEAVGRMALSNYIGTSLVMTGLFYGWGLGLFGAISRAGLALFVLVGWVLMLAWSLPWLKRFRYGPMEWIWRSIAQGRLLPIDRNVAA